MRITSAFIALALAGSAFAQSPPPKIPPAGITLSDADRAELTVGTEALQTEIASLKRKISSDPKLLALLPDVEIFHKAVAWSLADNTIYSPQEVAFAKHLLAEGMERAKQLRLKKSPWLDAKGLVVRGYRSKIDHSVQPYGLVVPQDLDLKKPVPLMVWLLGRGEKRTELAFLAEREGGPPQLASKGTITVIPYGRFCNATKFAGETDVMEALAAVRARYDIDPLRIAVAGFSMGGGSTWHLATHFPGLWCAASPGAGFAETPIFTKASAPGKEVRPEWEQTLWRQYEATGISGNLFNVPTLAYSGEVDGQKEASDLMEAAMAKEDLKLERFIGPKTGHEYHPETKTELTARFQELIAKGREPSPSSIRFSTYTLRYPECAWFRIDGLGEHWQRADVSAIRSANGAISLDLMNVTAFTISGVEFRSVVIGDQSILDIPVSAGPHHFISNEGIWKAAASAPSAGKHPGLTGPVDDAFVDSFVFVRPTGTPMNPALGIWVSDELKASCQLWHDVFRGEAPVIDDSALSASDIADKNLILWGDPSSNKVIAKILSKLPLQWTRENITFRDQKYNSADHAAILIFPNPLNPKRYIVLNSGIDFRADSYGNNALQTPKLPDWAIVDITTPPGPRWAGKIETAGFFNEQWK